MSSTAFAVVSGVFVSRLSRNGCSNICGACGRKEACIRIHNLSGLMAGTCEFAGERRSCSVAMFRNGSWARGLH
jgi:hypothetical protein